DPTPSGTASPGLAPPRPDRAPQSSAVHGPVLTPVAAPRAQPHGTPSVSQPSAPAVLPIAGPDRLTAAVAAPSAALRRAGPRYGPPADSGVGIEVRRLQPQDLSVVPDLVNADLLPGQPTCSRQLVEVALRGESLADVQCWPDLSTSPAVVSTRMGPFAPVKAHP